MDYPTVLLEHPHKISPDEFIPEIIIQQNRREYWFQCPSAGLFQCSITGLVFRMEGQGEVLYRTDLWDRRLLAQVGKRPAGPLFKFTCNKGSVCQLHLPHCEIHSEGGCDFLSVAHVKDDDSMMFINPDETTESHVILNITEFSKYGITKDTEAPPSPIHALVLPFYQLPDVKNNKNYSILCLLLLPKNANLNDVCETRKNRYGDREKYIEVTPNCELIPDQEYTLSTDLPDEQHLINPPEKAKFVDYEIYENYMPTFQLHLKKCFEEVTLHLKEHDGPEKWTSYISLPANNTEGTSTGSFRDYKKLPEKVEKKEKKKVKKALEEKVIKTGERKRKANNIAENDDEEEQPSTSTKPPPRQKRKVQKPSVTNNTEGTSTANNTEGASTGTTIKVSDQLLDTLEELNSEELNTFQWHLTKGVNQFQAIARSKLGNTNRTDTVDVMVQRYCDDAVKVTLAILRKMELNDLAKSLKQKMCSKV
ncbi:hypothetical protein UPYG_G00096370 [Umbra pygmaea]|uniref:Uncharacterized protein n=1 Tax=Umbra pygmaea TaxID=75934 RepID=A0ABD0XMK1_UMBPY